MEKKLDVSIATSESSKKKASWKNVFNVVVHADLHLQFTSAHQMDILTSQAVLVALSVVLIFFFFSFLFFFFFYLTNKQTSSETNKQARSIRSIIYF